MILGILAVFTVYFFWANKRQRKTGKFIEGTVCFFHTPFPPSEPATFAYFFFLSFSFSDITGRFSIYVLGLGLGLGVGQVFSSKSSTVQVFLSYRVI